MAPMNAVTPNKGPRHERKEKKEKRGGPGGPPPVKAVYSYIRAPLPMKRGGRAIQGVIMARGGTGAVIAGWPDMIFSFYTFPLAFILLLESRNTLELGPIEFYAGEHKHQAGACLCPPHGPVLCISRSRGFSLTHPHPLSPPRLLHRARTGISSSVLEPEPARTERKLWWC